MALKGVAEALTSANANVQFWFWSFRNELDCIFRNNGHFTMISASFSESVIILMINTEVLQRAVISLRMHKNKQLAVVQRKV